MVKTDYAVIAEKYDEDADRGRFEKEPIIDRILHVRSHIRILDLGCGTGNYIRRQNEHFNRDKSIEWIAADPSAQMLARAKEKEGDVTYIQSKAEDLDFPDGHFDFIVCNFAFHHFERKELALDKIQRFLREDGFFKLKNIAPERMEAWWVYHYCPKAWYEDLHRFWPNDLLVYELERRGLSSVLRVTSEEAWLPLEKIAKDFERRDISQLAMINDAAYEKGLEKLRRQMAEGRTEYRNAFALVDIEARRVAQRSV